MIRFPNFLSEEDHSSILNWVLTHEADFRPSLVGKGEQNEAFRNSLTLSAWGPCKDIILNTIYPKISDLSNNLGVSRYRIKDFDIEICAHNDGAYYKRHTDSGKSGSINVARLISTVYYFYRQPRGFSGGALRLFDLKRPGAYDDIEPEDNTLVAFHSFCPHEVLPVSCPSRSFANSRFAINVWANRALD